MTFTLRNVHYGPIDPARIVKRPSNLHRLRDCPGSGWMEAQCGEEPDTEQSKEGRLLHRAFQETSAAALRGMGLSDAQLEVVMAARFSFEEFVVTVNPDYEDESQFLTEYHYEGPIPGTADIVSREAIRGRSIIGDAKFGWLEVDAAPDNIQLAAYAIDEHEETGHEEIFVAIVQPRAPRECRLTTARYDVEGLTAARAEIERIIAATENEDAPLNTSPSACRYCRAKAICPAYTAELQAPKSILPAVVQKKELPLALARLGTDELGRLMDAVKFANMIEDGLKAEIHLRIGEDRMPGWGLKNTGSMRSVEDILAVYHLLKDEFENAEVYQSLEEAKGDQRTFATDFMGCAKLQIGSVEKLVRELTGLPSDDKAKAWLQEHIGHNIVSTDKAKSVQREKT